MPAHAEDPSVVLTNAPTQLDGRHAATCWGQAVPNGCESRMPSFPIGFRQRRSWWERPRQWAWLGSQVLTKSDGPRPGPARRKHEHSHGDGLWPGPETSCLAGTSGTFSQTLRRLSTSLQKCRMWGILRHSRPARVVRQAHFWNRESQYESKQMCDRRAS